MLAALRVEPAKKRGGGGRGCQAGGCGSEAGGRGCGREAGGCGREAGGLEGLGFFVLFEGFYVEQGLAGAGQEGGALVGCVGGDVEVDGFATGYEFA